MALKSGLATRASDSGAFGYLTTYTSGIKIRALSRGTSLASHFDDSFFIGKFANLKNAIIKDYLVMAQVVEHWTRVSKVLTSNRCGS